MNGELPPRGLRFSRHFESNFLRRAHPLCAPGRERFDWDEALAAAAEVAWVHSMRLGPSLPVSGAAGPDQQQPGKPLVSPIYDAAHGSHEAIGVQTWGVFRHHLFVGSDRAALDLVLPPHVVKGRSFLEVGTWDGAICLHAERLGARDIVCTDYHAWGAEEGDNAVDVYSSGLTATSNLARVPGKEALYRNASAFGKGLGFRLAHCLTGSRARAIRVSIYDLADVLSHGRYDVIYVGDVLYHLKHPLLALEALAAVASPGATLVLETVLWSLGLADEEGKAVALPACQLSDPAEYPANFFGCTETAVIQMLRIAGFAKAKLVFQHSSRAVFHALRTK
eukprot:gnl/TRDRNA2_/TRDRNA2_40986_c0_seq1.p1 gnl/TRDRNA2_/TRDRNA2_40986_c0~~gnl/TRDRNA2_/TRDRNA2_40986_c0_seq1.p1  ORF type:complete len:386 (+),score=50.43 gnl/TRDRNA2_/TRDRNA2_40986_c0_seq1:150-1160(+)